MPKKLDDVDDGDNRMQNIHANNERGKTKGCSISIYFVFHSILFLRSISNLWTLCRKVCYILAVLGNTLREIRVGLASLSVYVSLQYKRIYMCVCIYFCMFVLLLNVGFSFFAFSFVFMYFFCFVSFNFSTCKLLRLTIGFSFVFVFACLVSYFCFQFSLVCLYAKNIYFVLYVY